MAVIVGEVKFTKEKECSFYLFCQQMIFKYLSFGIVNLMKLQSYFSQI